LPRDARPNRSTPDRSRPCELDARIRVCCSRPCLLLAHQVSADSVQFDRPVLSRCVPMGPVLCQERKRDARPNRSTPDLSRPCELDAGFRVCCSRPCLLCAHRFSADSVMVDAGRLARPRPYARARCGSGKGKIGVYGQVVNDFLSIDKNYIWNSHECFTRMPRSPPYRRRSTRSRRSSHPQRRRPRSAWHSASSRRRVRRV